MLRSRRKVKFQSSCIVLGFYTFNKNSVSRFWKGTVFPSECLDGFIIFRGYFCSLGDGMSKSELYCYCKCECLN